MGGNVVTVKKKICAAVTAFLLAAPLSVNAAQQLVWYPMATNTTNTDTANTVQTTNNDSSAQIAELLKKMTAAPSNDALLNSLSQQQQVTNTLLAMMAQQQQASTQANFIFAFMSMKPEQQQAVLAMMAMTPEQRQVLLTGKQVPALLPAASGSAPVETPVTPVTPSNVPVQPAPAKTTIDPVVENKDAKKRKQREQKKEVVTARIEPIIEGSYQDRIDRILKEYHEVPAIELASPAVPSMVVVEKPQKSMVASIQEAQQDGLRDVNATGAEAGFAYAPSQIFTVWCKEGFLTDIRLQPGEELQYIGGGDTVRWMVDKAVSGNGADRQWHVYLKPLRGSIETNIIINTDRRSYQLFAKTDGVGYNPMVAWVYPQDQLNQVNKDLERNTIAQRNLPNRNAATPESLDFNYDIANVSGAENWTPVAVYNDGQKTYLKMPAAMANDEAPALFVRDGRNGLMMVNYRIRKGVYIVDRLFQQAELRNGKITVKIQRSTGRI